VSLDFAGGSASGIGETVEAAGAAEVEPMSHGEVSSTSAASSPAPQPTATAVWLTVDQSIGPAVRVRTAGRRIGHDVDSPVSRRRHPAWLSKVLGERSTAVDVSGVDFVAIGTGQTGATYRVSAHYGSDPGVLPNTFVIKLPAQDDTVRDRVTLGYRSECAFYATVADWVRVPTPQFYCEITEDARDYALLLADQAPAVQGDQIAGCGEREARLAVVALAGLHGPSWCDPCWLELPGVAFPRPTRPPPRGSVTWQR
jgi:hypothetical protein